MNYVGIDIHKRYSVCAAQDEQGRELEACWNWGAVFEVLEDFPEGSAVMVAKFP